MSIFSCTLINIFYYNFEVVGRGGGIVVAVASVELCFQQNGKTEHSNKRENKVTAPFIKLLFYYDDGCLCGLSSLSGKALEIYTFLIYCALTHTCSENRVTFI